LTHLGSVRERDDRIPVRQRLNMPDFGDSDDVAAMDSNESGRIETGP
jgi:hypothetical protein